MKLLAQTIEAGSDIQEFINVIEKLNHKYDEYEMYHHSCGGYPFTFQFNCTSDYEEYYILFLDHIIYTWTLSDYCDDTLPNENELCKICEDDAKNIYNLTQYAINDFKPTKDKKGDKNNEL